MSDLIEREYEQQFFNVKASQGYGVYVVSKGDILTNSKGEGAAETHTVDSIQIGPKWATYRNADGKVIDRVERDSEVEVERKVETEESKKVQERLRSLRHVEQSIVDAEESVPFQLKQLTDKVKSYPGGAVDPSGLMTAQANLAVWEQVRNISELEKFEGDLLDAAVQYAEYLRERMTGRYYRNEAFSRSTSVISNLVKDVQCDAEVRFVDDMRYRA